MKKEFLSISNLLRVQKLRKESGLSADALSLHLVLLATPVLAKPQLRVSWRVHGTGLWEFLRKDIWSKSTDRGLSRAMSGTRPLKQRRLLSALWTAFCSSTKPTRCWGKGKTLGRRQLTLS